MEFFIGISYFPVLFYETDVGVLIPLIAVQAPSEILLSLLLMLPLASSVDPEKAWKGSTCVLCLPWMCLIRWLPENQSFKVVFKIKITVVCVHRSPFIKKNPLPLLEQNSKDQVLISSAHVFCLWVMKKCNNTGILSTWWKHSI